VKEDALQKGLSVPDEAATRERVLRKNVEVPDLATLKDFSFVAASSKSMIVEQSTAKSLNTFGKWFFAGFSRVTGTPTDANEQKRSLQRKYTLPPYDISPVLSLLVDPKGLNQGRSRGQRHEAEA
jgi:hypothetical protein